MSYQYTILLTILWYIYHGDSQTCSCSGDGAEFSVTYSRSTTKQIVDEEFQVAFSGPMYCTNYIITDASSDSSCGDQNGLNYIIIPTTSDCLSTAIWSLRDVSNEDYVIGFDPLKGASPNFYIDPSNPENPTSLKGIKIPISIGLKVTRSISICTREDTTSFDGNDDVELRTIGYVLNDGTSIECVNATMRDICSASEPENNAVLTSVPTTTVRVRPTRSPTNSPVIITTEIPTISPTTSPTTFQPSTSEPTTATTSTTSTTELLQALNKTIVLVDKPKPDDSIPTLSPTNNPIDELIELSTTTKAEKDDKPNKENVDDNGEGFNLTVSTSTTSIIDSNNEDYMSASRNYSCFGSLYVVVFSAFMLCHLCAIL